MSRLKVDYNMVEDLITEMKRTEADIETVYSNMTSTVQGLTSKGYMEADSANAYINEFKSMLAPDMESLSELITKYYTQLHEICTNFAEKDKWLSEKIF